VKGQKNRKKLMANRPNISTTGIIILKDMFDLFHIQDKKPLDS